MGRAAKIKANIERKRKAKEQITYEDRMYIVNGHLIHGRVLNAWQAELKKVPRETLESGQKQAYGA